ncbi:MAG: alpha-L-rhamnosidase N-terminal domain-containing protein [Peptostreptococcaceae bacterium]|nr:alpha-L-rhamnosidase N-terminal domain-containing protein [Peptostreptococcaceae bacterium]
MSNYDYFSRRNFIKTSALSCSAILIPNGLKGEKSVGDKVKLPVPVPLSPDHHSILNPIDLSPARWLWYPMERCLANTVVLFRKIIKLSEKPQKALGYILADSRYKLTINGERVQWGPAPCDPRWMEADPLDLSKYLIAGENVIACSVLFFDLGDGTSPIGKPGLIFKLDIEMPDRSIIQIVSDDNWQSYLARSWRPGNYKRWFLRSFQEEFDARLYPYGWDLPEFVTDNNWLASKIYGSYGDKPTVCNDTPEYMWQISGKKENCSIRERSVPLMKETIIDGFTLCEGAWIDWKRPAEEYFESITPNAFDFDWGKPAKEIKDGEWKIEVRKNRAAAVTFECREQMVGWPNFTIDAPEGTIVEILVHEAHKPGGPVFLNSHFNSWTRFICKEGENNFETFDFESYRWIQFHIRNYNRPVVLKNISIRRRMYPWKYNPEIRTNDKILQRLWDSSVNTMYNSAQDTIVDGMARERQQYSGDGSHQLHAIYYSFGDTLLPARFVNTFGQGLGTDDVFMDSWPAFDRLARVMERQMQLTTWGPIVDHSVGFCFDSWYYYLYTGKIDALKETYPRLLCFFQFLEKSVGEDGLIPVENLGMPSVWIDHIAFKKQRHKQCALNLYVAAMCQHALSKLCSVFGNDDWSIEIANFGKQLEKTCIDKYWDSGKKVFMCNLPWLKEEHEIRYDDRSLATSIIYNQCPGGNDAIALKIISECPKELGLSYPCNAIWRYWALAKGRAIQVVIDDFRNRWGSMKSVIENNTLQEDWVVKHDSGAQWSHCAVSPLIMIYHGILGIFPVKPGFEKCTITPQPGDLEELSMLAHTVKGTIQFEMTGKKFDRIITISIPNEMDCEIILDQREKIDLAIGSEKAENGYIAYKLQAGEKVKLHLRYL